MGTRRRSEDRDGAPPRAARAAPPARITVAQALGDPSSTVTLRPRAFESLGDDDRARLRRGFVAAIVSEGAGAWPLALLAGVRPADDGAADWIGALDAALVEAWLRTGDRALLRVADPKGLHACAHLAHLGDSRAALRFVWKLAGTLPEIEQARPEAHTFYGWLRTSDLARVELPGGFTWSDVVGQPRLRWSLMQNKETSHLSGQRARTSTHDFQVFLHHGPLDPAETERSRTAFAARRGLRAALVPVDDGMEPDEARRRLVAATLDCHRRNVDIFAHRSVQGDAFFGRAAELRRIDELLTRGSGVAITGARKAGKSSLALQYAAGLHAPTSVLDFLREPSSFDAATLASAIARRVCPGRGSFAEILDHLARRSGDPPFLVVDEMGYAFEQARRSSEWVSGVLAMAGFLRSAVDDGLLRVILCSPLRSLYTRPYLETIVGRVDNPLLAKFDVISLRGLDRSATTELLRFYSRRCLVHLTDDATAAVVRECGGFPFLVRAALHRATNDRTRPLTLTEADVLAALEPTDATDSPWMIVRSTLWQWGIDWAREHLGHAARGQQVPGDDIAADLRLTGLLDDTGRLSFPLLARVAGSHLEDLQMRRGA